MTQRPSLLEKPVVKFVRKLTRDLIGYLQNNADSLPDYGKRYRSGQRISSAFVESTVNQLIDKRMSKSQQMRWDPQSAHQLLQVRVQLLTANYEMTFPTGIPAFHRTIQNCGLRLDPTKSNALVTYCTENEGTPNAAAEKVNWLHLQIPQKVTLALAFLEGVRVHDL